VWYVKRNFWTRFWLLSPCAHMYICYYRLVSRSFFSSCTLSSLRFSPLWHKVHHCCDADSMGHGGWGHVPSHFYKLLGRVAPWVEEQQTRNWPNCTDHHKALTKTTNCTFRARRRWIGALLPLQIRSGATAPLRSFCNFLLEFISEILPTFLSVCVRIEMLPVYTLISLCTVLQIGVA